MDGWIWKAELIPRASEESLPILVDVLRGVRDLSAAGLSHRRLGASVFMKDGRALIGNLGCATEFDGHTGVVFAASTRD